VSPASLFTLSILDKRGDNSLNTHGWISDQPCPITFETGASVTSVRLRQIGTVISSGSLISADFALYDYHIFGPSSKAPGERTFWSDEVKEVMHKLLHMTERIVSPWGI
jgi:hypothetical protein